MLPNEVHLVINDLNAGKCNWSLKTWILLNFKTNLHFLTDQFNLSKTDSINVFYYYYNGRFMTKDGCIYNTIEDYMLLASWYGQMDVVKLMLEKGADNYDRSMFIATKNGQIDIVKLMLDKGATEYNKSMNEAARHGHIDIVKLLLEKGADNYDDCRFEAEYNGDMEMVNLLSNYTTENWSEITPIIDSFKKQCASLLEQKGESYFASMSEDELYNIGHNIYQSIKEKK